MNRVHLPNWSNEYKKASDAIKEVSEQFEDATKLVQTHKFEPESYYCEILSKNTYDVLDYWTGSTYVGCKKNKLIQDAFQTFYNKLYSFLIACKKYNNKQVSQFANKALYQGTIYRYIGHGNEDDEFDSIVEPKFNDIYVSWSKKAGNSYLQSKLHGPKTMLTCEITGNKYGIDLEAFDVVRGDEAEVVFPTIKNLIKDIKYINKCEVYE